MNIELEPGQSSVNPPSVEGGESTSPVEQPAPTPLPDSKPVGVRHHRAVGIVPDGLYIKYPKPEDALPGDDVAATI